MTTTDTAQHDAFGWQEFRSSKLYDLLAALPLIAWYGFGLVGQSPLLLRHAGAIWSGTIGATDVMQFSAILGSALFNFVAIVFLILRSRPLARSHGILPRLVAFTGAFFGVSLYLLDAARLSLWLQAVSNILIFGGSTGSLVVLLRLGRSFTLLPEARELDMGGPYAVVRHPLYVFETIAFAGLVLQFAQPWALAILVVGSSLMLVRSQYEERVLESQFAAYRSYRLRTPRFIPRFVRRSAQ